MCTLEDLSRKLDTYIDAGEKRLAKIEKRLSAHDEKMDKLSRKDNELERLLMTHAEASITYYRSIDQKLDEIKEVLDKLPCASSLQNSRGIPDCARNDGEGEL